MSPFNANIFKRFKPSQESSQESETATENTMCKDTEYLSNEATLGASTVSDASLDDQATYQEQGHALLEDWPEREPSTRFRNTRKKVTISELSKLRLYNVPTAERQEWYSSKDREAFQAEALCEAYRIRDLMAAASEGGNTRGKATLYLLERNLLSPEEMLGIEELITSVASARNSFNERRLHTALVLKKQDELRGMNELDMADKLAEVASSRSSKLVQRARLRAALAAPSKVGRKCP
eukprot:CCRYP_007306-RA/>CCRYP_007306-RA protein AED:0.19 eAED:0.19 QI:0/-1/0/1/-1/1/1/0/237